MNSGPLNVEAQILRVAALSRDLVENGNDVVGVDRAVGLRGERLAGELVDDVQDLQVSPVSRLVELEVGRPEHVRSDRTHLTDQLSDASKRLLPWL